MELQDFVFGFLLCVKDGSGNPFAEFTQRKIAANSLTAANNGF